MPTRYIKRTSLVQGPAITTAAPIYVDSDDNILKMVPAGSGSTEVQIVDASSTQTLTNKTLTSPVITGATDTPTVLIVPTSATPAQTAEGSMVWDSDDDLLTVGDGSSRKILVDTAGSQTLTNKTLTTPAISSPVFSGATIPALIPITTIVGDGAASVASGVVLMTKGSAAAVSLAAPGAGGIGTRITFMSGSAFAHVVTFTGTILYDGTTNAPQITWTSAAFIGSSVTVVGITATAWSIESMNLGATA